MTVDEYNVCVDEFSDNVYRFVLKNIKNEDKAQDIIQDTYEKLWMKVDTVQYEKARSYLFTTAYHTMIDLIRRDKKQEALSDVNYKDFGHTEQYSDLNEVLHQAVNKLPEAQKAVIMLRDYEGYSYDEIAEITGLSESQVKVYIYRGRMFLKEYIGSLESII
jgi:RNA polymerase sigma-70 factor (ECF subfamily)